ncbi:competence type IV pilus minor pilin ComGD [Fundicoccus culcitae]|uniref:Competence type IV pilus minor pilin ComGD n=1 Tax=Fundicoccus culcitae TaxID=2969821 RepID=A0ABY5P6Q8_9LACT|nr:competence type IV pilus minor pilin ComGD [Fundicoccus culcitae]UUX34229.1 competence type IV pilus minor pilin ComGD [Fundicoccus culcitae]
MQLKKAFTLIETLLVLTLISFMLILLAWFPNNHLMESIENRIFFDQLVQHLNDAQTQAITRNQTIRVSFNQTHQVLIIESLESTVLLTYLYLPDNWQIRTTYTFFYLANGRTNRFDTLTFYHTSQNISISLVFQLGSGRFELR